MSLLSTKPRYFPSAIATESGWINPVTKELLVSVGGLKSKLALEAAQTLNETKADKAEVVNCVVWEVPDVVTVQDAVEVPAVETLPEAVVAEVPEVKTIKEEVVMQEEVPAVKTRKPYGPRKPKVIGETTDKTLLPGQQLIGEVVEYKLDTPVIGE